MRLIDADELIKKMQARYAEIEKEYTYYDSYVQGYGEALDVIENAPTVEPKETKPCAKNCANCGAKMELGGKKDES